MVAGTVVASGAFISIGFTLYHWWEVDWNMVSMSVYDALVSVTVNICYFIVLTLKHIKHWALWASAIVWFIFNVFTLCLIQGFIKL